jgi:hypothetical protein
MIGLLGQTAIDAIVAATMKMQYETKVLIGTLVLASFAAVSMKTERRVAVRT